LLACLLHLFSSCRSPALRNHPWQLLPNVWFLNYYYST
jgi:hypothetical protein